ncbi:MAG: metallopeptidase [Lachnospiraceae bacterium]|nr:metallopeptidase [Lachnospiraceae bacterium]
MGKAETEQEWQEHMSEEILGLLRSELYMDFRYMDVALSALSWCPKNGIDTIGTDGEQLFYSPEQLIRVYPKNPIFLNRTYLHSVLHCVFSHLWLQGNREDARWDLACDIMVEYVIDHLEKPSTKRILSWSRRDIYNRLDNAKRKLSAASIYEEMTAWDDEDFRTLTKEFYTDTHAFWQRGGNEPPMPLPAQKKWDKLSRQTQMQMEQRGEEDAEGQQLILDQVSVNGNRYRYSEFLRRFALLREEMQCDPEEFDMNFYSFGLRLYGNMPLVEPLETKEVLKIQTFVVVIDTSYSTSGNLVKKFIQQTAEILLGSGQVSAQCRIHIIQCDDKVQKDDVVSGMEELERLLQNFELVGGGGTDFRPAFQYVNELIEQQRLKDLSGLLYFTDGKGIYPGKRPDYQTAFVFIGEYEEALVPPWAMRYVCSRAELETTAV